MLRLLSREMLIRELSAVNKKPLDQIIIHIVNSVVGFHLEKEELCRVLNTDLPKAEFSLMQKHHLDCANIIEVFLSAHSKKVIVKDIKVAS